MSLENRQLSTVTWLTGPNSRPDAICSLGVPFAEDVVGILKSQGSIKRCIFRSRLGSGRMESPPIISSTTIMCRLLICRPMKRLVFVRYEAMPRRTQVSWMVPEHLSQPDSYFQRYFVFSASDPQDPNNTRPHK